MRSPSRGTRSRAAPRPRNPVPEDPMPLFLTERDVQALVGWDDMPEASLSTVSQLYVPARTPREIVEKLARALEKTVKEPAVAAAIEKAGMIVDYRGPDSTRKDIEAEYETLTKVAAKLGLAK